MKPSLNKQTYITQLEFTAKTFDTETAFLDPVVYKGTRCKEKCILDAKTRFKQTENLLAHISPRVTLQMLKKDLSKEFRILRKNSSETTFEENNSKLKKKRRLPTIFDRKPTIRNKIHNRESKLPKLNNKEEKDILPFVTQYQPSDSVYYKGSLNEKMESYRKPTITSINF